VAVAYLYREAMTAVDRDHLVNNLVAHVGDGVERAIQERALALFRPVDADLGARLARGLGFFVQDGGRAVR